MTNAWLYTIDIKKERDVYSDDSTAKNLHDMCVQLVSEIKKIEELVTILRDSDFQKSELKRVRTRFTKLSNDVTKYTEEVWYYDDDKFENRFDSCLATLYDIADQRVMTKLGISYKFIWIKTF